MAGEWLLDEHEGESTGCPAPRQFRDQGWEEAIAVEERRRACGYHNALPRQILVHEDMVRRETPKKAEV